MDAHAYRPVGVLVLALLLILLAVDAIVGGVLLIADPAGGLLGMPVSLLEGSPFRDYLVPGLILFGLLGVVPLAVVAGVWFRPRWAYVQRLGMHGAWLAAIGVGAALIVWILVQMTILRFFLQPVLLALGVAIMGVGLIPAVRRHYMHARAMLR